MLNNVCVTRWLADQGDAIRVLAPVLGRANPCGACREPFILGGWIICRVAAIEELDVLVRQGVIEHNVVAIVVDDGVIAPSIKSQVAARDGGERSTLLHPADDDGVLGSLKHGARREREPLALPVVPQLEPADVDGGSRSVIDLDKLVQRIGCAIAVRVKVAGAIGVDEQFVDGDAVTEGVGG